MSGQTGYMLFPKTGYKQVHYFKKYNVFIISYGYKFLTT